MMESRKSVEIQSRVDTSSVKILVMLKVMEYLVSWVFDHFEILKFLKNFFFFFLSFTKWATQ